MSKSYVVVSHTPASRKRFVVKALATASHVDLPYPACLNNSRTCGDSNLELYTMLGTQDHWNLPAPNVIYLAGAPMQSLHGLTR